MFEGSIISTQCFARDCHTWLMDNVIGRLQTGQSQTEIARHFNVDQSTISCFWQRLNQTGSAQDHRRSSSPRITTSVQDWYIRVFYLCNRTVTDTTTPVCIPGLRRISVQTVRNRLRQHQEDIMLIQFWPRYTDVHVFVCAIYWGSGLWEIGAECGSAMSNVFFSKDVMDEPAFTCVDMSVSSLSAYRKLTYLEVEASWGGQQYPANAEQT